MHESTGHHGRQLCRLLCAGRGAHQQFSCGCAVASLETGSVDEFLQEMDRQMYAEKERHHAQVRA